MNADTFNIILALVRCSMFNATDATKHQIERLGKNLFANGFTDESAKIYAFLNPDPNEPKIGELVQSEIIRCRDCHSICSSPYIVDGKPFCNESCADASISLN